MRKTAQSALEFLTTYGWAFLVIMITVSTLYYFGIFDFGQYLPQKCIFPSQMRCLDFSLRPTEVRLKLINNLGETVCVTSMQITDDAASPLTCTNPAPPVGSCATGWEFVYSVEQDLSFTGCSGGAYISGTRVELKASMEYYAPATPSQPKHMINGKIYGTVS